MAAPWPLCAGEACSGLTLTLGGYLGRWRAERRLEEAMKGSCPRELEKAARFAYNAGVDFARVEDARNDARRLRAEELLRDARAGAAAPSRAARAALIESACRTARVQDVDRQQIGKAEEEVAQLRALEELSELLKAGSRADWVHLQEACLKCQNKGVCGPELEAAWHEVERRKADAELQEALLSNDPDKIDKACNRLESLGLATEAVIQDAYERARRIRAEVVLRGGLDKARGGCCARPA
ncbi:unnamed protein product [Prorocentrum cordatum]|uniref:Uncharacterized protein n=1 Tax=Prorocentrum cordatum TaxID=2364126 RepID=A0ABN9VZK8_9DINO|nr:unnamed protein product [Polarella glacialis]